MVPGAGLEPAQLSPRDFKSLVSTYFTIRAAWWALQDSNLYSTDYESAALTIKLKARLKSYYTGFLGNVNVFEPVTLS